MKIVNPYFLDIFLMPITGLGDDEEVVMFYQEKNIVNEEDYRTIIREMLVKNFMCIDADKRQKAKLALSYYLSKQEIDFQRVFDSCIPPFDPPIDAREFFIWIWKELFDDENFEISDTETYKIVADIHEPNRPCKDGNR